MKPKIVIIASADWAGSGYNACRAINSIGEFECRHISTYDHIFEYPKDILVKLYPRFNQKILPGELVHDATFSRGYSDAVEAITQADIIHLWNSFPGDPDLLDIGLPIDWRKLKIITMTGTMYRRHHTYINTVINNWIGLKLTVQDALFDFPNEIESTFIPHAVDMDFFKPEERRDKVIGTYQTNTKKDGNPRSDVSKLVAVLQKYPDWKIDLNYQMPWRERMEKLARCSIFVQDIEPFIGIWGRSTLEACALAVPCLQNFNGNLNHKFGEIPLIKINPDTLESELKKLIEDESYRKEVGEKSRKWIEEHFSYPAVGKMYSEIYQQVTNEI